jgi:hypothetical protein
VILRQRPDPNAARRSNCEQIYGYITISRDRGRPPPVPPRDERAHSSRTEGRWRIVTPALPATENPARADHPPSLIAGRIPVREPERDDCEYLCIGTLFLWAVLWASFIVTRHPRA